METKKYSNFCIGFSEYGDNSSKVNNVIITDELIKFELYYDEQRYLIELKKISSCIFIGKATELKDRFIIDIAAKVFFDDHEIFICGYKWKEGKGNYSWSIFLEEE